MCSQATTLDDVSNTAFPYLAVREIEIGLARVRAARVGYVGELGWELHIPTEQALHVYETCARRARRTALPTRATAPSKRCGWRRATSTGRPT